MDALKKITIGVAATGIMLASALPAFAAKPVAKACLGNDISGYAQNGETDPDSSFEFESGAGWGGFISSVAQIPGFDGSLGVGGEINAHQAGDIPDFIIANSCN